MAAIRLFFTGAVLALTVLSPRGQTLPLPGRVVNAPTGSEFAKKVAGLELNEREQQVYSEVMTGNVPEFLRKLCPVQTTNEFDGKPSKATFFVTPDYLAIGSDADYLLMPLSPGLAQRLADKLNCSLSTRKMVNAIYAAAAVKLAPAPIPPSPAMTTVEVFSRHNSAVWEQRRKELAEHPLGALVAGHKKDVVVSAKLATAPGKVAIYGWHQTNGLPIQPLYLGHSTSWVDYSQCIRLVQQAMVVNGESNTVTSVLSDPALAGLLSDEGVIRTARYGERPEAGSQKPEVRARPPELQWQNEGPFKERVASLALEPDVRVLVNAPAEESFRTGRKVLLVFYSLPNGNTAEQTIGKALNPRDDWHYDIQHIGAQTRFLRETLKDRVVVVACLENSLKSWPAWRKVHGDEALPEILNAVKELLATNEIEIVLNGHSGGGSLIFGYLNAVQAIPDDVVRIAFLDSDYAYNTSLGHARKLIEWLEADHRHFLCVLAYNDAIALLDGKPFVSASGGTWGKSHEMERDLAARWTFSSRTNADFEMFSALDGRVQFILRQNPEHKVLHTVQVERNGFIHSLLTGTPAESRGYEYFGPRAYSQRIGKE